MNRDSIRQLVRPFFCAAGVSVTLLVTSCSEPKLASEEEAPPPPRETVERIEPVYTLPISRTLRDKSGRDLASTIIGKGKRTITIVRKLDGRRFDIAIADLSPEDREFVSRLPLHLAEPEQEPPGPAIEEVQTPPYIASREKDIGRLREKQEELGREISESSGNRITVRSLTRDRDLLQQEIDRLQRQIDEYRPSNSN